MQFVSIILFGLLGVLLAIAGVGLLEKPLMFCVILGVVMAISVVSKFE